MVIFEKIKYKNFLSAGNYWTEIDLNSHKSTLISGKNGAGKSTLIEALFFALYGKPFRKVTKKLLINSINKKDCLVELEVKIGKNSYKIIRGIKPEIFELYLDGVLIDKNSDKNDYQNIINEKIIRTNVTTVKQIFILGSATYKPFMELEPKERRSVIEDVLDIKVFSTMAKNLKLKFDEIKEKINEVNYKIGVEQTKKQFAEEQNKKINFNKQTDIEKYTTLISELQANAIETVNKKKVMANEIEELADILVSKNKKELLNKIQKRKDLIRDINQKKKTIVDMNLFLSSNDTCPTCKQNISSDFIHNTCSKNNDEIIKIEDGLIILTEAIEKLNSELSEIEEIEVVYKNKNEQLYEIDVNINFMKKEMLRLTNHLNELKTETESLDFMDVSVYDESLQSLYEELNSYLFERDCMQETASMLTDDGIKGKIIKKYMPMMNLLINRYLEKFELYINFELDENFDETIKSRYRDEFSYNSFSQGEKLRISLAIMLAWREIAKMKNSLSANLMIMDETLDGALDSDGISDMIETLHKVNDENIMVISHRGDQLRDSFERHIKFEKQKDFGVMTIE